MNWKPEELKNPFPDRHTHPFEIVQSSGGRDDEEIDEPCKGCLHDGFEAGADAILEALEEQGIKGVVKACCNPVAMSDGDVCFDDFDTNFISEDKELEVCLNGAEDMVYGKQACHIITPKKGWLVFIPDETNKEVKDGR